MSHSNCPDVQLETDFIFTDWIGRQRTPCNRLRPQCRQALVRWLESQTNPTELRLQAAGSGHSTSNVSRPVASTGIIIEVDDLVIDEAEVTAAERWIDLSWLSNNLERNEHLIRVGSGISIADLNQYLDSLGWALPNMGSYDAQTIIGAIATGTHGTGLITGPLADIVTSIELVTVLPERGVVTLRIEPEDGPTNANNFDGAHFGIELLKDTEAFESCVVGLGCFGILTAVTLKVCDAFWLSETQEITKWPDLSINLLNKVNATEYFDVVMTSLPIWGEHRCLITRKNTIDQSENPPERNDARLNTMRKRFNQNTDSENPQLETSLSLSKMGSNNPKIANFLAYRTLKKDSKSPEGKNSFDTASYISLRTSVADYVLATSAEIAVPLEFAPLAIDATISHLAEMHDDKYNHLSPIGIRFGAASRHYLSMHYGQPTCTIEAPILIGTHRDSHKQDMSETDITHMLNAFVDTLYKLSDSNPGMTVRTHWGQRNWFSPEKIAEAYPKLDVWIRQMQRFNPYGIFNHSFCQRLAPGAVPIDNILPPTRPSIDINTPLNIPEIFNSNVFDSIWFTNRYWGITPTHAMYSSSTHGHDLQLETPDNFESVWRAGMFIRLKGKPSRTTWVHFALPTPVIIHDHRLKLYAWSLRFKTDAGVTINEVHIYDGENVISRKNDLNWRANDWQEQGGVLTEQPSINWGIGISINIEFANADTSRNIDLVSALTHYQ